jgi:hypothetical protein
MRETRHEETEERPPGTSTFTRLPSRDYRAFKRDMPLSIDRCTVSLVGRLASSHGGQVSGGLALLDVYHYGRNLRCVRRFSFGRIRKLKCL